MSCLKCGSDGEVSDIVIPMPDFGGAPGFGRVIHGIAVRKEQKKFAKLWVATLLDHGVDINKMLSISPDGRILLCDSCLEKVKKSGAGYELR